MTQTDRSRRRQRFLLASAIFACTAGATRSVADDDPHAWPDAFANVPRDVAAAIVVPHVKRASDELAMCLEGMDRANALIGGRPVDQARALLGVTSGVDEGGSMVLLFPTLHSVGEVVAVVPVHDAREFITSNFEPDPAGREHARLHPSGRTVFVRALENAVALTLHENSLGIVPVAEPIVEQLLDQFDEHALRRAQTDDVLIYLHGEMAAAHTADLREQPIDLNPMGILDADVFELARLLPGVLRIIPQPMLDAAEATLLTLDFDPLGVGVHTFTAIADDTALAALTTEPDAGEIDLSKVAAQSFYGAGAMRAKTFGRLLRLALAREGAQPAWVEALGGISFVVPPRNDAMTNGLLGSTVAYISCNDPAATLDALAAALDGERFKYAGFTISLKISEANDTAIADTPVRGFRLALRYEGDQPVLGLLGPILFGLNDLQGVMGAGQDGILISFNRSRTTFVDALAIPNGGDETLADNAMLRQMSTWLPGNPDGQVFLGIGEIGGFVDSMIANFGPMIGLDRAELPAIDPATRPIGFGFDIRPNLIETGIVLPADAAAIFFDFVFSRIELVPAEGEES